MSGDTGPITGTRRTTETISNNNNNSLPRLEVTPDSSSTSQVGQQQIQEVNSPTSNKRRRTIGDALLLNAKHLKTTSTSTPSGQRELQSPPLEDESSSSNSSSTNISSVEKAVDKTSRARSKIPNQVEGTSEKQPHNTLKGKILEILSRGESKTVSQLVEELRPPHTKDSINCTLKRLFKENKVTRTKLNKFYHYSIVTPNNQDSPRTSDQVSSAQPIQSEKQSTGTLKGKILEILSRGETKTARELEQELRSSHTRVGIDKTLRVGIDKTLKRLFTENKVTRTKVNKVYHYSIVTPNNQDSPRTSDQVSSAQPIQSEKQSNGTLKEKILEILSRGEAQTISKLAEELMPSHTRGGIKHTLKQLFIEKKVTITKSGKFYHYSIVTPNNQDSLRTSDLISSAQATQTVFQSQLASCENDLKLSVLQRQILKELRENKGTLGAPDLHRLIKNPKTGTYYSAHGIQRALKNLKEKKLIDVTHYNNSNKPPQYSISKMSAEEPFLAEAVNSPSEQTDTTHSTQTTTTTQQASAETSVLVDKVDYSSEETPAIPSTQTTTTTHQDSLQFTLGEMEPDSFDDLFATCDDFVTGTYRNSLSSDAQYTAVGQVLTESFEGTNFT